MIYQVTLVFPKADTWPRRCSNWIAGLLPRRNCVFTEDRSAVGSNGGGCWSGSDRTQWAGRVYRNRAPGQKQSAAGVSRTGAEDEPVGHGEGGSSGRAERYREGSKGSGRAPGAGERGAGSSEEVAL